MQKKSTRLQYSVDFIHQFNERETNPTIAGENSWNMLNDVEGGAEVEAVAFTGDWLCGKICTKNVAGEILADIQTEEFLRPEGVTRSVSTA